MLGVDEGRDDDGGGGGGLLFFQYIFRKLQWETVYVSFILVKLIQISHLLKIGTVFSCFTLKCCV